jgi:hypothetical protein
VCSSSINILKYLVSYAAAMPLGIIQDRHLEHVPGTATLNDLDPIAALQEQADGRDLKRSKNGTILVPQPSDDPNGIASRLYSSGPRTSATRNNTNMSLRRRPSQLPTLATRLDHFHPLPQFRHRIHTISPLSREHARARPLLQHT